VGVAVVSLTYLDDSDTEVDQIIDGILFRNRESCVLIQPSPIFVCHSFSEQDIQSYYSDFVERATRQRRPSSGRRSRGSPHTAIIQQGYHLLDQGLWLFRIRSVPCRTALRSAHTIVGYVPVQHQQPHSISSSRTAPYIPEPCRGVTRTALSASGTGVDSPTYLSGRSR